MEKRKVLTDEISKEKLVAAGEGAVNAIITKGASTENLTGKSKAALTRMKRIGLIKVNQSGVAKRTNKGKTKYGY